MNIELARNIVDDLRKRHQEMSPDAIDAALEQLAKALRDQPDTLQINVSDSVDLGAIFG